MTTYYQFTQGTPVKNIKIRLPWKSLLWSSQAWRGPTAEYHCHNIHHTSAWPSDKAPLLSLGRGTEQQINKMQMAWITPKKDSGHDWSSTGVAGLKADNHPSNLFCVRSEVLARPLLLFAQGNYWFIYFYLHAFFMLEVLFTISPENIYIGPTNQRFRYIQDMLWENILRRVRKGC